VEVTVAVMVRTWCIGAAAGAEGGSGPGAGEARVCRITHCGT
jgi:hypothetical protein